MRTRTARISHVSDCKIVEFYAQNYKQRVVNKIKCLYFARVEARYSADINRRKLGCNGEILRASASYNLSRRCIDLSKIYVVCAAHNANERQRVKPVLTNVLACLHAFFWIDLPPSLKFDGMPKNVELYTEMKNGNNSHKWLL